MPIYTDKLLVYETGKAKGIDLGDSVRVTTELGSEQLLVVGAASSPASNGQIRYVIGQGFKFYEEGAVKTLFGALTLQSAYDGGNSIVLADGVNLFVTPAPGDFAAITLNANQSSIFSVADADLTLETSGESSLFVSSGGSVRIDAVDLVEVNTVDGAINIGTDSGAQTIVIGNATATRISLYPKVGINDSSPTELLSLNASTGVASRVSYKQNSAIRGYTGLDSSGTLYLQSASTVPLFVQSGGGVVVENTAAASAILVGTEIYTTSISIGTGGQTSPVGAPSVTYLARSISIGNPSTSTTITTSTGSGGLEIDISATSLWHSTKVEQSYTQIYGGASDSPSTTTQEAQLYLYDSDAATSGLNIGYRYQAGPTEYGLLQARNSVGATNVLLNPAGGSVGIGSSTPQTAPRLYVEGLDRWNIWAAQIYGDLYVGTASYGWKVGIATGGGGAGAVSMAAQGGLNQLNIGAGTTQAQQQAITITSGVTSIVQPAWTALPFTTGATTWADYAAGFQACGQMIDSQGFVHLRGAAKRTAGSGLVIATLATQYRPTASSIFAVLIDPGTLGYVTVASSGTIILTLLGGTTAFVSLEGITFDTR